MMLFPFLCSFIILCAVLSGCVPLLVGAGVATTVAANEKTVGQAVAVNKGNLKDLSFGISKHFALEVMGSRPLRAYRDSKEILIPNPYKTESFQSNGKVYEILYYATSVQQDDDRFDQEELTPLVLENDTLIGWGWDVLKRVRP